MNRKVKKSLLMMNDVVLMMVAWGSASLLLNKYVQVSEEILLISFILASICYLIVANICGVYKQITRFVGFNEVFVIVLSEGAAFFATFVYTSIVSSGDSYRLLILTFLLTLLLVPASRFFWRLFVEFDEQRNHLKYKINNKSKRALVIGAGRGGNFLLSQMKIDKSNINVVGIVDDDESKIGMWVQGKKVMGTTKELKKLIKENKIQQVIFAIPELDATGYKRIIGLLEGVNVEQSKVSNLSDNISGKQNAASLKDIDVSDLLQRSEVKLDIESLSENIEGRTILVSGAGGSIGSEIVRQVSRMNPKKVLLLGHGENSIYLITREMNQEYSDIEFIPIIGDVQDRSLVFDVMAENKPDIVYHAAAHKHVPLMEYNPHEAVKNNVLGTKNMADAAKANNVKSFVMVSTDKAVNSTSVMGASKRMAELIVTNLNEPGCTKFTVTRFGNVLGSRGSVVPLFKKQIAKGGPVTITDMKMTRYFMTIPEAAKLVIESSILAKGGQLFVLDMGEPVKIIDLATQMIKMSGYKESEIEIREVGLRPGEKLYEELSTEGESANKMIAEKIFLGNISRIDPQIVVDFANKLLKESNQDLERDIIAFANSNNGN